MVSKSVTIALTLAILLGFTASGLTDPLAPQYHQTPPNENPWIQTTHPWQDGNLSPAPPRCETDSASRGRGFIPLAMFAKFALEGHVKYVIKQESRGETRAMGHRGATQLLFWGKRDIESVNQNSHNPTK